MYLSSRPPATPKCIWAIIICGITHCFNLLHVSIPHTKTLMHVLMKCTITQTFAAAYVLLYLCCSLYPMQSIMYTHTHTHTHTCACTLAHTCIHTRGGTKVVSAAASVNSQSSLAMEPSTAGMSYTAQHLAAPTLALIFPLGICVPSCQILSLRTSGTTGTTRDLVTGLRLPHPAIADGGLGLLVVLHYNGTPFIP